MKSINILEEDYEKLISLLKLQKEIYGTEGVTTWSFDDLNDLQKIGTDIVEILNEYIETNHAEIIFDPN